MSTTAIFFLKLIILFVGVYVLILLTPHIAAWIDSRKKWTADPEAPRPERVDDDLNSENSGENADEK